MNHSNSAEPKLSEETVGTIVDIQRFAVHDGPGIRTLVFLKGCPLRCQWCANPESINPQPELGFYSKDCNICGKCVIICPQGAVSLDKEHRLSVDRGLCNHCGRCVSVCFPHALFMYGCQQSAAGVFSEVKKDMPFYATSAGGVTISGGEPLSQASFVKALFALCHEVGIHTAMETCGFAPSNIFRDILGFTDYCLFDLKCMDTEIHKHLCGQDNALILENARILSRSGVPFIFRVPVIPRVNDNPENLTSIGIFIKESGLKHCEVELMPYHRLGTPKYDSLGREYLLRQVGPPTISELEAVKTIFERTGVRCMIRS